MSARILSSILFFLLVFTTPWWFSCAVGFVLLVVYVNFWEIVVAAVFIDLLFGTPISLFYGYTFVLGTTAIILYIARRIIAERIFVRL